MPDFANDDDRQLYKAIVLWKLAVAHEIDEIRSRRDDGYYDRVGQIPPHPPNMLFTRTAVIVAACHAGGLDPAAILDTADAVRIWHADRNAENLPPQSIIDATADRAVLVACALESGIESRLIREGVPVKHVPRRDWTWRDVPEFEDTDKDDWIRADAIGKPSPDSLTTYRSNNKEAKSLDGLSGVDSKGHRWREGIPKWATDDYQWWYLRADWPAKP